MLQASNGGDRKDGGLIGDHTYVPFRATLYGFRDFQRHRRRSRVRIVSFGVICLLFPPRSSQLLGGQRPGSDSVLHVPIVPVGTWRCHLINQRATLQGYASCLDSARENPNYGRITILGTKNLSFGLQLEGRKEHPGSLTSHLEWIGRLLLTSRRTFL